MTSEPQVPSPAEEPAEKPAEKPKTPPKPTVPFTRVAAAWWALIVGTLVLIVLLVFIAQNLETTTIHFLTWHWNAPVGVAFLVAAISGSLITVATGTGRMMQLRRAAKRHPQTPGPDGA
jgi:uncharacterized integral membrane protein